MKEISNLFLFFAICFLLYLLFRSFHYNREGMTDASGNSAPSNGIAGNSTAYAAGLKTAVIKLQDTLLVSKYQSDYETAILNLDDLINNLMLNTALTVNPSNPQQSITDLSQLQQAKTALNSVMTFLDSSQ
jgi:hypothetical protein